MTQLPPPPSPTSEDDLFERIAAILETARGAAARSVNTAMVHAYWRIGREVVQIEQGGDARAGYGEQVIERVSARLRRRFGSGFGPRSLRRMRQFYAAYPVGSAVGADGQIRSTVLTKFETASFPSHLSWSHYLVLLGIADARARSFYEIEAVREAWSVRELERQE